MIETSLRYLTFILFLIPFTLLIFDSSVLFPYITTKALVFRALVTLALPLALIPIFFEPKKIFKFFKTNFLIISIFLFFISQILATIFSLNPYRSFWGNAERMEGLWSLFFYILYFLILFLLFSLKPEAKKTIFISFLFVSVLISWIEIQQYILLKSQRPSATLGNPTYIGFFNLLNIFLIAYFIFETKRSEIKFLLGSLVLLNFISLLTSETRGSILGLFVGLIGVLLSYLIVSKSEFKKKLIILGLFISIILVFFIFLLSPFSSSIPGFNRLQETLSNPISVFPRIFAWKIFLDGFKSSPIIGYGPETEPIVFFKFFDPKIYEFEAAIFDRPHNKFVQVLVNSGLLGFLSWISIFVSALYLIFKRKDISDFQKCTFTGFIFAYLGQNFSLFDMQASYLLFFFGLSLIAEKLEIKFNEEKFIRPLIILSVGISLIFFIIHAQHYYIVKTIITTLKIQDPLLASKEFLRLSQIAGPFLTEEAIMASNYLLSAIDKINKIEVIDNIYNVIEKAYLNDKYDVRLINRYAEILKIMINLSSQNGKYQEYLKKLEKLMDFSLNTYPKNYELRFMFLSIFHNLSQGIKHKEGSEEILVVPPLKEVDRNKLIKIAEEGERYASNSPRFYVNYLNLLNVLNEKIAYQKTKEMLKKPEIFKNNDILVFALKIFYANKDVENLKKLIEISKNYSFDKETKEKIIYFEELLKNTSTSY